MRALPSSLSLMNTANYHRELHSILKRMDCFLPPMDASFVASLGDHTMGVADYAREQHVVIEAKPTCVSALALPSKEWKFVGQIPSLHHEQASRREFVESKTVVKTSVTAQELTDRHAQANLPNGLTVWHASDYLRRMMVLIRRDLDYLFQSDLDGMPHDKTDGLFALPGTHHLSYKDCMHMLVKRAPYVHKAMLEYARMACVMYGCDFRRFLAAARPRIRRMKASVGLPLRLVHTRQARFDGGPVFLASFGMPVIPHDLAPVLPDGIISADAAGPFRLHVSEGALLILDGDVRACYSHGVPGVRDGFGMLYIMSIHVDCLDTTSVMGYEPLTKTVVMHTPICASKVITTRSAPVSRIHAHISVHDDTMWRIVQAMRWRLQMVESNLIRERYEERAALNLSSGGDRTRPSPTARG